jgi:hypothetical protein
MKPPLPAWALAAAGPEDRLAACRARDRNVMQVRWKAGRPPRAWAKQHGWPTPWFGFEQAFVAKLLASDESFQLALAESGIEIFIPKEHHGIGAEELALLDEAYRDHSWRWLVEALREIRRAVEAGVVVQVEEATLRSFQGFYNWAHGRYHALEDDVRTAWIGDDSPHPRG